jgi:hypothetical protein
MDALTARLAPAFAAAKARWAPYLQLRPPSLDAAEGVAHIDLSSRQIKVNAAFLERNGLEDCLEALLAHEIGHHVRWPGTLGVQARLRLLERPLLPLPNYSAVNLYTDLLINRHLGAHYATQFARIYRAEPKDWSPDPAFLFYLTLYEVSWGLPPGDLCGPGYATFAAAYPDARADAELFVEDAPGVAGNVYLGFLYFVSVLSRYVKPPKLKTPEQRDVMGCGCGEPSPDDWGDALTQGAAEKRAIEAARARGWITDKQRDALLGPLDDRVRGLPGVGTGDANELPAIMAAHYRKLAERYALRPPSVRALGDAVVPATLEEWELGDPVRDIDWLATLSRRGEQLGVATPLRRERIADIEGRELPMPLPKLEIYLDVSGSMPDPRLSVNTLTLAAQILTLGAVRAGGAVRALVYSYGHTAAWEWCRSEREMSRFLMHYIGGGTRFPFDVLAESVQSCGAEQPVRVVISDHDFDTNHADDDKAGALADAAARSRPLVLLLHNSARHGVYRALGARVVPVDTMDDYPRMAAGLSRALFAERRHVL